MNKEDFMKQIGEWINKDQMDLALDQMISTPMDNHLAQEVILASARYQSLKKQIRMGVLTRDQINKEKNTLRFALVELAKEIYEAMPEEPPSKAGAPNPKPTIQQHHSGSGDNIAGDKNITYS